MELIKDLLRRPTFWCLLLILAAMSWVGSMDYEDALLGQQYYCKMVANGHWPDYDGVYKDECVALGYPAVPAGFDPVGDAAR